MKNNSYTLLQGSNSGITRLKLNDPGTYNSLSTSMLKSLISRFKELDKDQKTRVIIIEGSGKGFSAGHNLKEVKSLKGKPNYKKLFELCSELMMVIINCNKPVIAKVHGAAFAAGCQLVATCDLALSTDDAIFSTPGVNIGLFCSTPMVALSRNVARKRAMRMLLTGEPVSAKHAKDIGLTMMNCNFSNKTNFEITSLNNENVFDFHDREIAIYGTKWLEDNIKKMTLIIMFFIYMR